MTQVEKLKKNINIANYSGSRLMWSLIMLSISLRTLSDSPSPELLFISIFEYCYILVTKCSHYTTSTVFGLSFTINITFNYSARMAIWYAIPVGQGWKHVQSAGQTCPTFEILWRQSCWTNFPSPVLSLRKDVVRGNWIQILLSFF